MRPFVDTMLPAQLVDVGQGLPRTFPTVTVFLLRLQESQKPPLELAADTALFWGAFLAAANRPTGTEGNQKSALAAALEKGNVVIKRLEGGWLRLQNGRWEQLMHFSMTSRQAPPTVLFPRSP